jgi:polysaccharide deacetylase family protein (PEP-CTERM system associated)
VEDWFQVEAFARTIPRQQWDVLSSRVEINLNRLLDSLAEHRVSATFFVLGWIADRHPALVRRIAEAGHEIASHGYGRIRAHQQSAAQFRDDLICSKAVLEELTGQAIIGYRAPGFSLGLATPWAHAIIGECGYRYSSSVRPGPHGAFGVPNSPRFPYRIQPTVVEIPVSSIQILGRTLPGPGGGYFRLYPYRLSHWALQHLNHHEGASAVYYCHLWEIDPEQPKAQSAPLYDRLLHALNLNKTHARIKRLLTDFQWGRIDDTFADDIFGTARSAAASATPLAQDLSLGQRLLTGS